MAVKVVNSWEDAAPVLRDFTSVMTYSSSGSRWGGLPIGLLWAPPQRSSAEYDVTCAFCVYTSQEVSYSAFGSRESVQYRPSSTIFLRKGTRVCDHVTAGAGYQTGVAILDEQKISELAHDDVHASRIDFLELVVGADEQLSGMLKAMIAEGMAGNPAGHLLSQSLSIALLTHLYDRYDRSRAAERLKGRLVGSQVAAIRKYVQENVGRDLSVVELANLLHLSPWYFSRAFSKAAGSSPHRFVLNARIATAKARLLDPSPPDYTELAKDLGFASQSHFCSSFRKIVGCSPSEFRKRSK